MKMKMIATNQFILLYFCIYLGGANRRFFPVGKKIVIGCKVGKGLGRYLFIRICHNVLNKWLLIFVGGELW